MTPLARPWTRVPLLPPTLVALLALGACGESPADPLADPGGLCSQPVDLFPVPVSDATTRFPSVDDSFLEVAFDPGFEFEFFGTPYGTVFLNTNGGMTFGGGDANYSVAAVQVGRPAIAVFWGDHDAAGSGADRRANQMRYQVCPDRFVVTYQQLQDWEVSTWSNSATVTLEADGRITIAYGSVLSQDILVGVFDGTHQNDRYLDVQTSYSSYSVLGTGVVLFDTWGQGPIHSGQLSSRTITFHP